MVEPLIPPARRRGNKCTVDVREVVNSVIYILGTGCQWKAIRKDLGLRSTAFGHLSRWGTGTAPWRASTMRSTCSAASSAFRIHRERHGGRVADFATSVKVGSTPDRRSHQGSSQSVGDPSRRCGEARP